MSAFDLLMLASQLAVPLALVPGLWIAARWLPDVNVWLSGISIPLAKSRIGQLMVWLALGVLFANPLMDFLRTVVTIVQVGLGPAGNTGTMGTIWGEWPFSIYSDVSILMTVLIYVLVVWVGYRLWPEAPEGDLNVNASLAIEEWFVLLAAASLVNRFVLDVVQSIIWLPIPNSIEMGRLSFVGFFGAWLIGLAVLAVILLVLLNSLRRSQPAG